MNTNTTANRKNGTSARQAAPRAPAIVEAKPDLIRCRAYEIFLGRLGGPGDQVSDWLQAERELNGATHDARGAIRSGERRGSDTIAEVTSHTIRDGILDNR